MANTFEKNTFGKRFGSMLKVDFKRLFLSRTFYIIVAACGCGVRLTAAATRYCGGYEHERSQQCARDTCEKIFLHKILPPSGRNDAIILAYEGKKVNYLL